MSNWEVELEDINSASPICSVFCGANLPSPTALYAISVRQARDLPIGRPFNLQNPAFFRFRLTTDTLAFG